MLPLKQLDCFLKYTPWSKLAYIEKSFFNFLFQEGVIFLTFPWFLFTSYLVISSVHSHSHVWLCDSMDWSTPGLPVRHQLPEFIQTHIHWVSDAIQTSHPLSSPSPPAFNLSQHQSLFHWVSSLHQVAKVLEFQLQHQSFQLTPRTDFL